MTEPYWLFIAALWGFLAGALTGTGITVAICYYWILRTVLERMEENEHRCKCERTVR